MSDAANPSEAHYFAAQPRVASKPSTVTLTLPDTHLVLATDRGVFAADAIDTGTRLLLMEAPPLPVDARNVADVGCGYGPIALTMARRAPHATVWAIDVNERALTLCARNAEAAGVADRVRTVRPEEVPDDLRLDAIWSNPPIRIGKAALHALLASWLDRLAPEAVASLVVQKHLGSDSLARWLTERGHHTERVTSRAGYRILAVRPTTSDASTGTSKPTAPVEDAVAIDPEVERR